MRLPGFPDDDPRVIDSTGALSPEGIPKRLLVVGGGIIGLEMATVYDALGSKVTVVELMDQLIPGCDPDLVRPLHRRISGRYEGVLLETKVESREGVEGRTEGDVLLRRGGHVRRRPGGGRPAAERGRARAPTPPA